VKTARNAAHVTGTVTLLASAALLNAKLSVHRLPIDELQTLLPAVGVRLPRGATLQGGTVTADLAITGPVSSAEFSGPIDVESTTLTGFNLGSKLNGLATLSGIVSGNSTAIQSLRTDVVVGPNGVNAQNLSAALPALGTASGAGTVSPYGVLNFHLLVKPGSRAGAGGDAFGIVSTLGGLLGHTPAATFGDGIPITITGTQEDPRIRVSLPLVGTASNVEQDGDKGLRHVHAGKLLQGLLGH
jgi:AsmA protein